MLASGSTQSLLDYALFTKRKGLTLVIVLVYMDDLLITGNDYTLIQETKQILHHHFKIKDFGELRYFLGIEFCRSKEGIHYEPKEICIGVDIRCWTVRM